MKPKKPLPKHAVLAAIVLGGILVIAAGWLLAVKPEQKKAASLQSEAASVQQQIQSNLAAIAAAKAVPPPPPKITIAPVYRLAQAMPSTIDMPDLLLQLDEVAKAAGVTLSTISPAQPIASLTGGYSTASVELNVTGDFYSITDLLYRLRNLVSVRNGELEAYGRLYTIDSVTLAPAGKTALHANVSLTTYVYGSATSSTATTTTAPPAAPPPTTTTGTTTTTSSSSGPSAAGAP